MVCFSTIRVTTFCIPSEGGAQKKRRKKAKLIMSRKGENVQGGGGHTPIGKITNARDVYIYTPATHGTAFSLRPSGTFFL